jgi:hypothetical protein
MSESAKSLMDVYCSEASSGNSFPDHFVGKPIYNPQTVREAIKKYLSYHHIDPKDPNATIATLYGLNQLKAFIRMVDDYNMRLIDSSGEQSNFINAVRMYNARTTRTLITNGKKVEIEADEVILVPVKADGKDLFDVFDVFEPNAENMANANNTNTSYSLGRGTPCPNQCKGNTLAFGVHLT